MLTVMVAVSLPTTSRPTAGDCSSSGEVWYENNWESESYGDGYEPIYGIVADLVEET